MTIRCDVLAVGTELLLGQIADTNSAWIGEQLAATGITSQLHVQVGDNVTRIEAQLRRLLDGADAVIVCGGLGPTHDDVTREAAAAVMGVELVRDDAVAELITGLFSRRGRPMPVNNLRQAMVPVGAAVIEQRRGTAPGLICPVGDDQAMYLVPGVPVEMREMLERAVLPDLVRRSGDPAAIVSHTLKTWGEGESQLNERLDDIVAALDHDSTITLAFLARGWNGMEIRLTTRAESRAAGEARLAPLLEELRDRLGSIVFGDGGDSMESVVLAALRQRGLTLGLAESLTGGLVGARLTDVPGASSVFRGAVVAYAGSVKEQQLGVADGPKVTEAAAAQMAEGCRQLLGADVGLGLTGVAGPDPQPGEPDTPVGTVCVAVAGAGLDRATTVRLGEYHGREQIRQFAVVNGLDLLRRQLSRAGE